MKVFYRLMLLLAGIAFITSCSEDDFDRTPVLNVQQKTLSFTSEAEEKSVKVEINDKDELRHMISASGIEWIKVVNTTGGLKVSVLKNGTLVSREATITVLLLKGALTEAITVSQAAGVARGDYIDVSKNSIDFENIESQTTVLIDANIDWTLSVDPTIDWLTIDQSQKENNTLLFKATANAGNKKRTAEIKLAGSGTESIITIVQKGVMYFDLPFINIGYIYEGLESERGFLYKNSLRDTHTFELARGSTLNYVTAGVVYRYFTKSPVFHTIEYLVYSLDAGPINSIRTVIVTSEIDPWILREDPDFLEFIQDEGFEHAWIDEAAFKTVYWNKEKKIAMELLGLETEEFGGALAFIYSKVKPSDPKNQTHAYETFDVFPAYYADWTATAEQVIAWEATKGSRFLPGDSSGDIMLAFAPNQALEPGLIERVYYMDKTTVPRKLIRTLLLLDNMEKALYPTGMLPESDMNIPSNEFKALMLANGYKYNGQLPFSPIFEFIDEEKGLWCDATMQRFSTEGYIPRFCMQISPYVKEEEPVAGVAYKK